MTSLQVTLLIIGFQLPDSTAVGIIVTFLSAILLYFVKQEWEKRKMRKALLIEVKNMKGLAQCADSMDRINKPPGYTIKPKDVPAPGTIPTIVYEANAGELGVFQWFSNQELSTIMQFYSDVMVYKSIIHEIKSNGTVSDSDQGDLYNHIRGVSDQRDQIMESSQFKLEN
ncbi:hypothetical protein [Natronorarus salvus]|uniref:hypothetical protein n=1 Tax=Natronorarus salvus TaxID=3117733 RepID=UPI002F267FC9